MGTPQRSTTQQPTSGTCHLCNFEYMANHPGWTFMIPIIQDPCDTISPSYCVRGGIKDSTWAMLSIPVPIAVAEVNVCHAAVKIFGREKLTQQDFCLGLAKGMIFNT